MREQCGVSVMVGLASVDAANRSYREILGEALALVEVRRWLALSVWHVCTESGVCQLRLVINMSLWAHVATATLWPVACTVIVIPTPPSSNVSSVFLLTLL